MSKITINDIAKMANVSKSTVSRYLNSGNVSEETATKIKKIIDEYNYEPNIFAQSLKAKSTKMIGIIVPRVDSIVTSRAIMSIDKNLKSKGYSSLILNTSLDNTLEIEYLEMLLKLKVDGIILITTKISDVHKQIIAKISVPVLVVGQKCEETVSIINDDYGAGMQIGKYVKSQGHKKVLYIGVDEEDEAVGVKRRNGVFDQFKEDESYTIKEIKSSFTAEQAEKEVTKILKDYDPTVIICATDKIAVGAMNGIEQSGARPFEDISVTGFGGYSLMRSKLTTVRFDSEQVGTRTVDTLVKMLEHKHFEKVQTIAFDFIKGTSVKKIEIE